MFGSYRALLARPGARRLTALCAISWLSYCGYALAMVLVVHAQTGSFGQAGTCAAGVSLGTGFLAPARGHWVQSRGASAMRGLCAVHAASGALLLIGVGRFGVDVGLPAAIFLGASSPPLIAVARSRWTEVGGTDLAGTGHALFAAISDVAQLAGPALVGGVSAAIDPLVGFAILITGACSAGIGFSTHLHPTHTHRQEATNVRHSLYRVLASSPGLRTLMISCAATSCWINGLELVATSVAARHGAAELGAIPISASSLGGIMVSLTLGARPTSAPPGHRYLAGLIAGASALSFTLLATTIPEITAVFVLVGGAFGLMNTALFQLIDTVAPANQSIATFNVLATTAAAGAALGATLTGHLLQTSPTTARLLLIGVAVISAALVLLRLKTLTHSTKPSADTSTKTQT
jgi:hypothetical protein